jgi:hypothetical protein
MFSRKKDAKKFAENLEAPRQLRSSAPSPLFQLGHKEQPVRQDQLKPQLKLQLIYVFHRRRAKHLAVHRTGQQLTQTAVQATHYTHRRR